ncbi:MAG: zinc-binding dehydrogenase [Chloroflexi bacterium]|nr:zinc-binding dehydrogenase [Chloroflexota bacterium]
MRGAVLLGDRQVELREFPDPEPGVNQVVVRMRASGLCGSELHSLYQRSREERQRNSRFYGYIGGHEPCGVVEKVGVGVEGLKVGDRVVVYHIQGCGYCKYCTSGWMLHCPNAKRSYGWDIDGGHADMILVHAANCIVLPDELTFADGACCACGTGTAYQGLRRIGVSGRDRFVAYGLGPVGLSGVMLARAMGAEVIGVDLIPERLKLAEALGASVVIDASKEDPVAIVREMTEGEGAEAAADFSGNPQARNNALDCVRIWGRVAFVGEGNLTTINPSPQMLHKQLTVVGSWVFGLWELRELLGFLVRHGLHPDAMVTHRFPLEQIAEALMLFDGGQTGKVTIGWS